MLRVQRQRIYRAGAPGGCELGGRRGLPPDEDRLPLLRLMKA